MTQNKNRLVVVHNPNSTHAARVPHDVFDPLRKQGVDFTLFETTHSDTETNINDMREVFRTGDTLLITGGDGTKMQAVNAVERNNLQTSTELAFLPYGNYNDLAEKVNVRTIASGNYTTSPLIPMTVELNEKYWRHAPSYLTLGFTALAASKFSEQPTRKHIEHLPPRMRKLGNFAELASAYFELHTNKLPHFHTSRSPQVRSAVTDLLFLNSRRAGGIIRSHPDYASQNYFGYHEANVGNIVSSLPFGISALAGHATADPLTHLRILFEQKSSIPIQSEGEFAFPSDVSSLFVYKNPTDALKIIRKK